MGDLKKLYTIQKNFLSEELCKIVSRYALLNLSYSKTDKIFRGKGENDNEKDYAQFSTAFYKDPLGLSMLTVLKDKCETIFKKKLLPSYSFLQVYTYADIMKVHRDRDSCEYSASIMLAKDKDWNFIAGEEKIIQDIGDAIFYEGSKLPHGREGRFTGDYQVSLFLHYVDAEGLYKNHKNDIHSGIQLQYEDEPYLKLE